MTTMYDLIEEANIKVEKLLSREGFTKVRTRDIHLGGSNLYEDVWVSDNEVVIRKSALGVFNYYGGFDQIKDDGRCINHIGDYVVYDIDVDQRIATIIEEVKMVEKVASSE